MRRRVRLAIFVPPSRFQAKSPDGVTEQCAYLCSAVPLNPILRSDLPTNPRNVREKATAHDSRIAPSSLSPSTAPPCRAASGRGPSSLRWPAIAIVRLWRQKTTGQWLGLGALCFLPPA